MFFVLGFRMLKTLHLICTQNQRVRVGLTARKEDTCQFLKKSMLSASISDVINDELSSQRLTTNARDFPRFKTLLN